MRIPMSVMTRRRRGLAFGFLVLAVAASVMATLGRGEPSAPASGLAPAPKACTSDPKPDLTKRIMSAAECQVCHAVEKPTGPQVICRMDEYLLWARSDKHKNAYEALRNPLGRLMLERLGHATDLKDRKSRACLGCHSVPDREIDPKAPGVVRPIETGDKGFDKAAEGVTCVACHGASGDWVALHGFPAVNKEWRKLNREEKARDHGMVDLWDPITRLRKCASCHVGNVEEGKVVTHAMYAAGHPPLPGFELATFSDAMPYHWEYLAAKVERTKDAIPRVQEIIREQQRGANKLEQTELVSVSGLVPLRETLTMLVSEAEAARKGPDPDSPLTWPDFARFDCYACHHDVTSRSWRQARPFTDAPGRPPLASWPVALVELGVQAASAKQGEDTSMAERRLDQYRELLRKVHRALGARPYGDRDALKASAGELIAWTDGVLAELCDTRFDPGLARLLLGRIARKAQEGLPDFDTARQLYWAFRVIHDEISTHDANDEAISALLDRLDALDRFRLPDAGKPEWIERTLAARKEAVARFDPAEFQRLFGEIQKLTDQKRP